MKNYSRPQLYVILYQGKDIICGSNEDTDLAISYKETPWYLVNTLENF